MARNIKQVADKIAPPCAVILHADFVRMAAITSFLAAIKYTEPFGGKDTETVIREILATKDFYTIWCSLKDGDNHFGPDLVLYGEGEGEPAQMKVPWNRILGILQYTGEIKFPVGFGSALTPFTS